jgi:hypothetical protein
MGRRSKQKGSSFERKICVQLSLWVSNGKDKDLFWRSAMSGGRATVAGRKGDILKRQCGDVCSVSPNGHKLTDQYYVECKHVRSLQVHNFLLRRGLLYAFWQETKKQARIYNRAPMLIAKENNFPVLVLFSRRDPKFEGPMAAYIMWTDGPYNYGTCEFMLFQDLLNTKFSLTRRKIK